MKPEIKAKWVAALRSGEFRQTNRRLKRVDPDDVASHCCLGVLCELYRSETGQGEWGPGDIFVATGGIVPMRNGLIPPIPVQEWAGLTDMDDIGLLTAHNDPQPVYDDTTNMIVDTRPSHSFSEIADLIENYL